MRLDSFRHHVLALMMVSEGFASMATTLLQPRYFDNSTEQHMCRFMLEHYREYHKCPKKLVLRDRAFNYFETSKNRDDLKEEFDLLLDIVVDLEDESAEQAEYIQNQVVGFCQEQSLKEALIKSVDDIQGGKFADVLPRIQSAMSVGAELEGTGDYFFKDAETLATVQDSRLVVPTGCEWIDIPLKGGLAKRELGIVMAGPNVGKTTALINIGVGAAKMGKKVAHFTLELSQAITRAKYLQCYTQKTDAQLDVDAAGRSAIAKWMKSQAKNLGSDIYIKEFPAHRLTIEGLRAHLMLLKSRDNFVPDLVLVDYMDLMALPTHIKDEIKQLTWLGVELRALAGSANAAIWTVTQTNRGGYSKETAMGEDVSQDFMKLATCDALVSLNQTPKEAENEEARAVWIKNRFGKKFQTYKLITQFDKSLLSPA